MRLIVGLGNPGREYARNRHNVGFRVADEMARRAGLSWGRKFDAEIGQGLWDGEKVCVVKPTTYMNHSGQAVAAAARFYKVATPELVVVHDDMDLAFGRLQVKRGGGHAGHNGLRSIAESMGGPDFARIRVGVGRPPSGWDAADYVLSDFSEAEEQSLLSDVVPRAADAAWMAAVKGPGPAMNVFNGRTPTGGGAQS